MNRADVDLLFSAEALELLNSLPSYDPAANIVGEVGRLRARGISEDMTRVVLKQRRLRATATAKFGDEARHLFFTDAGLQQATRSEVAAEHAARFVAARMTRVADIGCGIGGDAVALARRGIDVTAVDRDEATAMIAHRNLAEFAHARAICADATEVDVSAFDALWFDPARRNESSTRLDPADWSPSLDWVFDVAARQPAGVKLSPAVPHDLIPDGVEAQWIDDRGDTVECVIWTGSLARTNIARSAVVLGATRHELSSPVTQSAVEVGPIGAYVFDPSGAVIRAQLLGALAEQLGAHGIADSIAYLSSDNEQITPFAQTFAVTTILPLDLRTIAAYCADHKIGTLEIKKRGVDIDPAHFRTRLKLRGPHAATLILTRAGDGRVAIVGQRIR